MNISVKNGEVNDMIAEIIKIIIGILVFTLGWRVWIKVVDRFDELLKRKLSGKTYDIVNIVLFVFFLGLFITAIFYRR